MFRATAVAAAAFAALTACSTPTASTKATSPANPPAESSAGAPVAFDAMPAVGTRARCPVSGEVFTVTAETVKAEHQGKTFVFCCAGCKPQFEADPAKYAAH